MRRRSVGVLMGTALFLTCAGTAAAQNYEGQFWRSVREPGHARAMHLALQGMYLIEKHRRAEAAGPFELHAMIDRAIERFALAHRLAPNDPMMVYLHAAAVAKWEEPGSRGGARRDDEALALFREVRELDPTHNAELVAFEIAVIHTRAHRSAEAAAEYQRAIGQAIVEESVPWSNLAEVTMLAGDLEGAVRYYERALEITNDTGETRGLALFGLAVALDRLGEHQRALEVAAEAIGTPEGTGILRANGVFYEPAYELHYYEGLAHRAEALDADDADDRDRAWAASCASFRRFVAEGGSESPWGDLAQRHADADPPWGAANSRRAETRR